MPTRRTFLRTATAAGAFSAGLKPGPTRAPGRTRKQPATTKAFSSKSVPKYGGQHQDVYDYIDAHFDEHLAKIQAFLRQPSVSAQSLGIAETARMVVEMVREIGAKDAALVPTKGHPGVWGTIDAGATRTLLNYGMYDVQPVNPEEWTSPPWEARIVPKAPFPKVVMARGATNTKGALRGFLNACDAIIRVRGRLPVNLQFAIEGEEEIGSVHYNQIIDAHEAEMRRADGVLFAITEQDPNGSVSMNLGVKGIAFIEIEADGSRSGVGPTSRDIHSSLKAVVDAPVWRLVQGLATLTDASGNGIAINGYGAAIQPASEEDWELINGLLAGFDETALKEEYGVRRWIGNKSPREMIISYLFDTTINIAGIYGGYSGPGPKTILPMRATAKIDTRLVPNQHPETAVEMIRRHLAANGFADLEVRFLEGYPPAKTSVRTPLVQQAIAVYRKWGVDPQVWPRLAGSAPFYVFTDRLKKPFVMFGLGHGAGAHSKDEYLVVDGGGRVADLRTTEKAWVDLLFALSGA
jgi:acetylornithine deacetylase/succinyl-diaminopimelate desuccinylase-like protein